MDNTTLEMPWYAIKWLSWSQLSSFEWQRPYFFYLLFGLLPLLMWGLSWQQRFGRIRIAFHQNSWKRGSYSAWLRYLPRLLLLMSVAFLCISLARPQRIDHVTETWSEGIDIVLSIDISPSMQLEDLKPNRLEAAKRVALDFVKGRNSDRIGVVVFAGDAFSKVPLTQDYDLLRNEISSTNFELIREDGTAIGSAIATATNRLRSSTSKSKVIVLLSDGENTAGQIDPLTAARLADAFHIKIYTIAIGRSGRIPLGQNFLGQTQYVENRIDTKALKEIATIGKGKFYQAVNNRSLSQIFKEIDQLERSEIKETHFLKENDYYNIYLQWAMACILGFIFLKGTFMSNILQD